MPIKKQKKIKPTSVEELKTEFVSIVSHQMRTPLSAVKWNLESLLDNKRGNALNSWQKDKIRSAYQCNERMINLVDDLLNLSQLDSGQVQLNLEKIDMNVLCREIAQQNAVFAKANNVKIIINEAASLSPILGDRNKLTQVIDNLVNNAIKYSRGHGQITLSAQPKKQAVEFSVQDQGIGIPKENQPYIFQKFFRGHNALHNQADGTGLGLFIAKRLIELQQGKMWFESIPHQGTCIYFTLPKYLKL